MREVNIRMTWEEKWQMRRIIRGEGWKMEKNHLDLREYILICRKNLHSVKWEGKTHTHTQTHKSGREKNVPVKVRK